MREIANKIKMKEKKEWKDNMLEEKKRESKKRD